MSLASNYPIEIRGEQYAPFKTWSITYNDSVTVHETEGGQQEDTVVRRGRISIAVSTVCLEDVANKLSLLEDLGTFTVKFYDIKTKGYVTINARVAPNSMVIALKEGSAKLGSTNGVWNVSFTLEEF